MKLILYAFQRPVTVSVAIMIRSAMTKTISIDNLEYNDT
jgi:hypothetical protein